MGTLGRQGNPRVVEAIRDKLQDARKEVVVVLISEVSPARLAAFEGVEAWVQVGGGGRGGTGGAGAGAQLSGSGQ